MVPILWCQFFGPPCKFQWYAVVYGLHYADLRRFAVFRQTVKFDFLVIPIQSNPMSITQAGQRPISVSFYKCKIQNTNKLELKLCINYCLSILLVKVFTDSALTTVSVHVKAPCVQFSRHSVVLWRLILPCSIKFINFFHIWCYNCMRTRSARRQMLFTMCVCDSAGKNWTCTRDRMCTHTRNSFLVLNVRTQTAPNKLMLHQYKQETLKTLYEIIG